MKTERGNVLFLILIAVALFAALSYAVTSSSKGGGNGITKDKAKILAAQLVQHGVMQEQAITRMILKGVPEHGVDVGSPVSYPITANASCGNDICKLFHTNGGGISQSHLDEAIFDKSSVTASNPLIFKMNAYRAISVLDVGSTLDEIMLVMFNIDENVCIEINRAMGINDGGNPPTETYPGQGNYMGTLSAFPEGTGELGDQSALVKGQRTFCAYHDANFGFTYYHVLMAR